MDSPSIAEGFLALVMDRARASTLVGDLLERRDGGRGRGFGFEVAHAFGVHLLQSLVRDACFFIVPALVANAVSLLLFAGFYSVCQMATLDYSLRWTLFAHFAQLSPLRPVGTTIGFMGFVAAASLARRREVPCAVFVCLTQTFVFIPLCGLWAWAHSSHHGAGASQPTWPGSFIRFHPHTTLLIAAAFIPVRLLTSRAFDRRLLAIVYACAASGYAIGISVAFHAAIGAVLIVGAVALAMSVGTGLSAATWAECARRRRQIAQ